MTAQALSPTWSDRSPTLTFVDPSSPVGSPSRASLDGSGVLPTNLEALIEAASGSGDAAMDVRREGAPSLSDDLGWCTKWQIVALFGSEAVATAITEAKAQDGLVRFCSGEIEYKMLVEPIASAAIADRSGGVWLSCANIEARWGFDEHRLADTIMRKIAERDFNDSVGTATFFFSVANVEELDEESEALLDDVMEAVDATGAGSTIA